MLAFPVNQTNNNMWYEELELYLTTTDDNSATLRVVNPAAQENTNLREHSFDATERRYEVPEYFFNRTAQAAKSSGLRSGMGMEHRNGPFSFDLTHPDDETKVVLTTLDQNLMYMDKFL